MQGGATRLDLALHPAALGDVAIRIVRGADGATAVHIDVARPEALAALHRDAPQLQAALDRAGLPAAARSVTLALAPNLPATPQGFATGDPPRERTRPRGDPRPRPRARASTADFPVVNITA